MMPRRYIIFGVGVILAVLSFLTSAGKAEAANKCCIYYEGSGPDDLNCNLLADDSVASCDDPHVYPVNLKGGYETSASDQCIPISGFAAYKKNDLEFCTKALELNQVNNFESKINAARASFVKQQLEAIAVKLCCVPSISASCYQATDLHAPYVKADIIKQIKEGWFDDSLLSPSPDNVLNFLSCVPSGNSAGWKIENTSCNVKPKCSSATTPAQEFEPSAIDLASEAKSLNPFNFSTGKAGLFQLIGRLIRFLVFPIGVFLIVFYIWAGFLWMTSQGNAEKVGQARQIMVWTTLGVIATLASYMLVNFVFGILAPK